MKTQTEHTCDQADCAIRRRVLIVDDEPGILFAYQRMLEEEGIQADSCNCLCEALEYLTKHQYLAVVTDIDLKGREHDEGLCLLGRVRQLQPEAVVIVASAASADGVREEARQLGASHYLEKPVNPVTILGLLKRLVVGKEQSPGGLMAIQPSGG